MKSFLIALLSMRRQLAPGEVAQLRSVSQEFVPAEGVLPPGVWPGATCLASGSPLEEVPTPPHRTLPIIAICRTSSCLITVIVKAGVTGGRHSGCLEGITAGVNLHRACLVCYQSLVSSCRPPTAWRRRACSRG